MIGYVPTGVEVALFLGGAVLVSALVAVVLVYAMSGFGAGWRWLLGNLV